MQKLFLSILAIILINSKVHSRELLTAKLYGLGGAGVGGMFVEEAAILNPAPMAFSKVSSISYQRIRGEVNDQATQRQSSNLNSDTEGDLFIIADAKSQLKGTMSYQAFRDSDEYKKRYSLSFASAIGEKSSLGVNYRYTIATPKNAAEYNYHQTVFGVSHIIDDKISVGAIIVDPFKAQSAQTKVLAGFMYRVSNRFFLLGDYGGNYTETISDTAEMRGAIRIMVVESLFLNFGVYRDKNQNTKGDGIGLSWGGPRLSLDVSYQNAKVLDENSGRGNIFVGETEKLTNLSLSMVF